MKSYKFVLALELLTIEAWSLYERNSNGIRMEKYAVQKENK